MRAPLILCAGCLYLLASGGLLFAGQAKTKVPPSVGKSAAATTRAAAKAAKNPGRPVPADQLRRLLEMPPEQRQKALEGANLNPQQRQRVQNQLERLDSLAPAQRERQLDRIGRLEKLTPDRQRAVNQQIQAMRGMTVAQRRATIHSPDFEQRFSPDEQQLIKETFPNAAR